MVTENQKKKAELFLKLHHDNEILVLLNSWDPGSSKLIEASGYKAIGTTSMGLSASLGYPDRQEIPFIEMVEAISRIVNKVNVPVTADIEAGYGSTIQEIVESTKRIIETGIVGINIEDSFGLNPQLLKESELCKRIAAIRSLSDSMGLHLVINARTDSFLISAGTPAHQLNESIKRGNKYREAGADCIFVPNVWEKDKIAILVKEINAPINILSNPTNGTGFPPSIMQLQDLGVARVSFGSSLMKSTLALVKKIADEISRDGTYNVLAEIMTPMSDTVLAYKMAVGIEN